jgi:hypothetical protein
MSWAGLANNQTVSFTNLKDAVDTNVFIAKTTQTTSNEQVTKADAEAKVYLDTTTAAWTALASNQLPVKSDFTPATEYTVTIEGRFGTSGSIYNFDVYAFYDSTSPQYINLITTDFCGLLGTIQVPSGSTLYIYAIRAASPNDRVFIRGGNTCPANLAVTCEFNAGTITANATKGITVYVDGNGDPQTCT